MDTYSVKFTAMQQYVPFLDRTIRKLERAGDRAKEPQLLKMKSLHGLLTDPSKKVMRFETLLKCEEVLQKLYEKVEGVPFSGSGTRSSSPDQSDHRQVLEGRAVTPRSPSPEKGRFNDKRQPKFDPSGRVFNDPKGPGLLGENHRRGHPQPKPVVNPGLSQGLHGSQFHESHINNKGQHSGHQENMYIGTQWTGNQSELNRGFGPEQFGKGKQTGYGDNRNINGSERGGRSGGQFQGHQRGNWGGGDNFGRPPDKNWSGSHQRQNVNPKEIGQHGSFDPKSGPPMWDNMSRSWNETPSGNFHRDNNVPERFKRGPRDHQDSVDSSMTPKSPEPDTPMSPEYQGTTQPKSIPLEAQPKYIPLERTESDKLPDKLEFRPKLSEAERKNKLLKLKSKLEGIVPKECSSNYFVPMQPSGSKEHRQEPDSQKLEDNLVTPKRTIRQPWLSPPDPESPPVLKIAESPASPDTQTASPQQMASPDTQTVTPEGGSSPNYVMDTPASPDGPQSPDGPASPEPDLHIQDMPTSPDTATSPTHHMDRYAFDEPLREIPTVPVSADSTKKETEKSSDKSVPPLVMRGAKNDPRRRDPRSRGKEPSPYDPKNIPPKVPDTLKCSSGSVNPEIIPPAYMSNIISSNPPPSWQQPRLAKPNTMSPTKTLNYGHPQPHMPQLRFPPPFMPQPSLPMSGVLAQGSINNPQNTQINRPRPRNYREYRQLKEEVEKKRKEMEEKLRKEHKSRMEAEEKATSSESGNENTTDPPQLEKPKVEIPTVANPKAMKESKDPRKRKQMVTDDKEDKISAECIKSFKIPKVNKSAPEIAYEENSNDCKKLKEIDIFKPSEVKAISKTTKKSSNDGKKEIHRIQSPKKMEKFITKSSQRETSSTQKEDTKHLNTKGKESKESIEDNTKTVESFQGIRENSDSDSEPELTIAEDTEERKLSQSSEQIVEQKPISINSKYKPVEEVDDEVDGESRMEKKPPSLMDKVKQKHDNETDSCPLKSAEDLKNNEKVIKDNNETITDQVNELEESVAKDEKRKGGNGDENNKEAMPHSKETKPEDGSLSKNELTKELLKNIVSTLDAKEAKRLLEKASQMEKVEKISLSDLQSLLTTDSDAETGVEVQEKSKKGRGRPKTPVKEKKSKKSAKKKRNDETKHSKSKKRIEEDNNSEDEEIIPNNRENLSEKEGVMKTKRRKIYTPQESDEEENVQTEKEETPDEVETFIIEPKPVPKRERRKRGKAPKTYSELDEDLQDDAISSSNIVEQNLESKEPREESNHLKEELVDDDAEQEIVIDSDKKKIEDRDASNKVEQVNQTSVNHFVEKKEDEKLLDVVIPSQVETGMRQTRSMRSKPKSKTWHPPDPDSQVEKKVFNFKIAPIKEELEVKREPVEADIKVFLGESEVAESSFVKNTFVYNEGKIASEQMTKVKKRHSNISNIFDKLQEKNEKDFKSVEMTKDKIKEKSKNKHDTEILCSKIKFSKPILDYHGIPLLPPAIIKEIQLKPPEDIKNSTDGILSKLSQEVSRSPNDQIPDEQETYPKKLLEIVQDLKRRNDRKKQPPPPLIPINENDDRLKLLRILPGEADKFVSEAPVQPISQHYKTDLAMGQLLLPDNLQNLFKCMVANCAFTSSSPDQFEAHISWHLSEGYNPLHCSYCLGKGKDVKTLISHIIRKHGKDPYQCVYCLHRKGTILDLLFHVNTYHQGLPKLMICCRSLPKTAPQTPNPPPPDLLVKCPILDCPSKFAPSKIHMLDKHIGANHPNLAGQQELIDFSCFYCDYWSLSQAKILLHQSFSHRDQPAKVSVRQVDLRQHVADAENSSSSEESESDSDSESDLSDFDKHFYDDDIESLDNLENVAETKTTDGGLVDNQLYRCGNKNCLYAASNAWDFKEHLTSCELASGSLQQVCFHCGKEHHHVPNLLEHLKIHSLKRLICGLCDHKSSVMSLLKLHFKNIHKITNVKFHPVEQSKQNPEEDSFIIVPKNALPKGPRSKYVKETFSPADIDLIPIKPEIYKYLLRCTDCDFSTRVRFNLIKHLRLHKRQSKLMEKGIIKELSLPHLTPVNIPPVENKNESNYSRMQTLLPEDEDEDLNRKPLSEADLAMMPSLIAENLRYACSAKDCNYITIDEIMLIYHITAFHKNMKQYKCPHCKPTHSVSFEEMPDHLKCHGELLFKCGYCNYYHWKKRIAEEHVSDQHPDRKVFVKNVREDEELRKELNKVEESPKKNFIKKKDIEFTPKLAPYEPYKCALCDHTSEKIDDIRVHCKELHDLDHQYKCGFCNHTSESKPEIETHSNVNHPGVPPCVLKMFNIDPTTSLEFVGEETKPPVWAREMEGLKHIRGILYEDENYKKEVKKVPKIVIKKERKEEKIKKNDVVIEKQTMGDVPVKLSPVETKHTTTKAELDYLPMQCKECGFTKKTVTGLKMHIKLNHLQLGKFQCRHCVFTANLKVSIQGHYRNNHAATISKVDSQDTFDYEERSSEAKTFSQDYWKEEWGIPTMDDRKTLIQIEESAGKRKLEENNESMPVKKKGKPGPKKGSKRKQKQLSDVTEPANKDIKMTGVLDNSLDLLTEVDGTVLTNPSQPKITERSKFESSPTYMCIHCPRRSQGLERLEIHFQKSHPEHSFEFKELSREQVINTIMTDQKQTEGSEFRCFYCHEVGSILALKTHNQDNHVSQTLRVIRLGQGARGTTGYLECQLCGYLSPGLEKHLQKAHFHEDHPLESDVRCSKYVGKVKAGTEASSQQAFKFDVNAVFGMTFSCPLLSPPEDDDESPACSFTTQTLSQMTSHLRKHTKTYKCGHCGNTFRDSSDFHQHSALSHGDKIPDLVKDTEAEAEYEALKGLLEHRICSQLQQNQMSEAVPSKGPEEQRSEAGPSKRLVARKSTGPSSRAGPGDRCRNVATKSTGPRTRDWPETRISVPYSFYKLPREAFEPRLIKTRMAMGGIEITLDAEKMGELLNIDPKLVLDDCEVNGSGSTNN